MTERRYFAAPSKFDSQTGLLTNQKARKNGNDTMLDLTYEYNRLVSAGDLGGKTGHLTRIVDNKDNARNREYEFDAVGRLIKAKGGIAAGAGGGLANWTQTYTYDRFGNRTNVTALGTAADGSSIPLDGLPNLSYDNASNRITTSGVAYDAAPCHRLVRRNAIPHLLWLDNRSVIILNTLNTSTTLFEHF